LPKEATLLSLLRMLITDLKYYAWLELWCSHLYLQISMHPMHIFGNMDISKTKLTYLSKIPSLTGVDGKFPHIYLQDWEQ